MKFAKTISAVAVSALFVGGAQAADVFVEEVVAAPIAAPAPTWDGFYGGIHIGYGWAESTLDRFAPGPVGEYNVTIDPDGVLGGLQIGYDWQVNNIVFGAIADISLTGMSDTGVDFGAANTDFWETEYEWIGTVRGRIGWLLNDSTLIYGHGGFAFADITTTLTSTRASVNGQQLGGTETGWVVGAGVEALVRDRVSVFAEYSYLDFGANDTFTVSPGPNITYTSDEDPVNAFKIGVNFRLP